MLSMNAMSAGVNVSSSAFLQVDRKSCDFGIYPVVPDFPHET
jgi:hypothetical protein